jgi:hypothetical protein
VIQFKHSFTQTTKLTKCLCEREVTDVFVVALKYASSIPLYKIEDSSMLLDNEETLRKESGLGISLKKKFMGRRKQEKVRRKGRAVDGRMRKMKKKGERMAL